MKHKIQIWFLALLLTGGCSVLTEDEPEFGNSGLLRNSLPIPPAVMSHLVGNFRAIASSSLFRGRLTVKNANSRLALYSYEAETYAVFNAGCVDNAVVFEGRTRDPASQTTGLMRLRIAANQGGTEICAGTAPTIPHVRYTGEYGSSRNSLTETISLEFETALKPPPSNLYIIGHHGCRTVDACGASENSIEGINYASYLGANAVEIDVLLSKDGVPFLYHDPDFNSRLTTGILCLGDVTNYTILLIKVFCRLKYGEIIPTLREVLTHLLNDDSIKMIWIDPKTTAAMGPIVALANEFQTKPRTAGGFLEILVGIPDDDYLNAFKAAPGYGSAKCLVEYSVSVTLEMGCRAYGPRFTLGPQPGDAGTLHSNGKVIFYWTVNDKSFFPTYLGYGAADGFISDRTFLLYSYFQQ